MSEVRNATVKSYAWPDGEATALGIARPVMDQERPMGLSSSEILQTLLPHLALPDLAMRQAI